MPRLDGISLAKGIRKLNSLAIIIFMTNRNDLMHVSFAVQPFYFIRKSNFEDDCKILFPLLIERLNKIKKKILLMINGRRKIVEIASIVYIESYNHHIHMHIKNGEVMILKNKLSDILLEIGLESIVQIHKSYLVNMAYIDYLYGNTVYLKDNKSLPLGRKFKDSVKIKYEWYLML